MSYISSLQISYVIAKRLKCLNIYFNPSFKFLARGVGWGFYLFGRAPALLGPALDTPLLRSHEIQQLQVWLKDKMLLFRNEQIAFMELSVLMGLLSEIEMLFNLLLIVIN
jgi:hypothetical protein